MAQQDKKARGLLVAGALAWAMAVLGGARPAAAEAGLLGSIPLVGSLLDPTTGTTGSTVGSVPVVGPVVQTVLDTATGVVSGVTSGGSGSGLPVVGSVLGGTTTDPVTNVVGSVVQPVVDTVTGLTSGTGTDPVSNIVGTVLGTTSGGSIPVVGGILNPAPVTNLVSSVVDPTVQTVLGSGTGSLPVVGNLLGGTTGSLPVVGNLLDPTTGTIPTLVGSVVDPTVSTVQNLLGSTTGGSLPVVGNLLGSTGSLPVVGNLLGSTGNVGGLVGSVVDPTLQTVQSVLGGTGTNIPIVGGLLGGQTLNNLPVVGGLLGGQTSILNPLLNTVGNVVNPVLGTVNNLLNLLSFPDLDLSKIWQLGSTQLLTWDPSNVVPGAQCLFNIVSGGSIFPGWQAQAPCSQGQLLLNVPISLACGTIQILGQVLPIVGLPKPGKVLSKALNVVKSVVGRALRFIGCGLGTVWPRGTIQMLRWDATGIVSTAKCTFKLLTQSGADGGWSCTVPCSQGQVPITLPSTLPLGAAQILGQVLPVPGITNQVVNTLSGAINIVDSALSGVH